MSETERLEERLRELGAPPPDAGDWEDVLRRAGGRFSVRRFTSRRVLLVAAAALVVAAAAAAGVLVMRGARTGATAGRCLNPSAACGRHGPTGAAGATGANGATGLEGPTGAFGPTGVEGPTGRIGPTGVISPTSKIGPIAFSAANLKAESKLLQEPFFWVGPRPGDTYEFTHYRDGFVYVRYLPASVHGARVPGKGFLLVATQPMSDAFARLKRSAQHAEIAGPDGSIIYVTPNRPNVLVAFPNVDALIQLYDPHPGVAMMLAKSGSIRPVG